MVGVHPVDQRPIRPGASHYCEVADLAIALQLADGDGLRGAADLRQGGGYRVERETEMARNSVCAAHGDDSQSCDGAHGLRDQALNYLVDGAVATAGENHFSAVVGGDSCLG